MNKLKIMYCISRGETRTVLQISASKLSANHAPSHLFIYLPLIALSRDHRSVHSVLKRYWEEGLNDSAVCDDKHLPRTLTTGDSESQ